MQTHALTIPLEVLLFHLVDHLMAHRHIALSMRTSTYAIANVSRCEQHTTHLVWDPQILYCVAPDVGLRYPPEPVSILQGQSRTGITEQRLITGLCWTL